MALGIGIATQGWGAAIAGPMGLGLTGTAMVSAGVQAVCSQVGLSLAQNSLNLAQTVKDMTTTEALLGTLEAVASAGLTHSISGSLGTPMQAQTLYTTTQQSFVKGLAGHFQKNLLEAAVKAGVHTGFQLAQGQHVKGSAVLQGIATQTAAGTIGGAGANMIGASYQNHTLDPLSHKALHGILGGLTGGILNGADGARAGALAAALSETMAEALSPQVAKTSEEILEGATSQTEYDVAFSAYLRHQKDLVLLTTAAIIAGLGEDVNTAIQTADNALTHNFMQSLSLALDAASLGLDVYEEDLQENRELVIAFLVENTDHSRETVAEAVDMLVAAGRVVCKLNEVVSQIGGGKRGVTRAVAQGVRSGVKGVKLAAKGGALRQNAIPSGSKIEYIGPGKVKFDDVEFRAVRDLGHMDEGALRKMMRKGVNPENTKGIRLDGHHHQQQYHREPGAFMVEIPEPQHCISNPIQHPLGTSGGLTVEQRTDWNKLRKAFNKERAKNELIRRGLIDDQ